MKRIARKAQTAWRLGPLNIARVAAYRAQLRLGRGVAAIVPPDVPVGPFFLASAGRGGCPAVPPGMPRQFGWLEPPYRADGRPDWFANGLTGRRFARTDAPWFALPDFDAAVGDIKFIWEWSRFDWVLRFAQRMRADGDPAAGATLNDWISDWLAHNPPYRGPNWKCGQEASIRVLHLWLASRVLGATPPRGLIDLVALHLARIAPTVSYAIAQDNNHGTSEGAALFIGGTWLEAVAQHPAAAGYTNLGRRLLENRAARLFMPDGTFAQYSINYHRMALDALAFAELARRDHGAPSFSDTFTARARAATRWLAAFVDPASGYAPLLGANDGARLAPFGDDYRDFRPSLVRASAMFSATASVSAHMRETDTRWLGLAVPEAAAPAAGSYQFDDGGFAVLRRGGAMAAFRYPRFRFRPNQADLLHVDLWLAGANVLPDGGTYSYNTDPRTGAYFGGTTAHNTIRFDDRDQMPRLSRFLFGDWPTATDVAFSAPADGAHGVRAGYRDTHGASHVRDVRLEPGRMVVTDTIAGFRDVAILRWRMADGRPTATGAAVRLARDDGLSLDLAVTSQGAAIRRAALVRGEISTHYGRREPIDVFEVEVSAPTTLVTTVTWPSLPATS